MKCRCGRDLCTFLIASSPPEAITARRSLTIPFTRCFKTRNFLNYFLLPPKRVGATKTWNYGLCLRQMFASRIRCCLYLLHYEFIHYTNWKRINRRRIIECIIKVNILTNSLAQINSKMRVWAHQYRYIAYYICSNTTEEQILICVWRSIICLNIDTYMYWLVGCMSKMYKIHVYV